MRFFGNLIPILLLLCVSIWSSATEAREGLQEQQDAGSHSAASEGKWSSSDRNVMEFGARGYPSNDTASMQSAFAWVSGGPNRRLHVPAGVWLVDGLVLDGCIRCRIDASAATFLWSGSVRVITDRSTGVAYPQSVLLIRGDVSSNQGGSLSIGGIDGWDLKSDGLFVASSYAHRIEIGSIYYTRYAINYSPHMNYGSDTNVKVQLIKRSLRGIYQAPDYLFSPTQQNRPSYYYQSHLAENVRFDIGIILDCIEYGIKRDAPMFDRGSMRQSGSSTTNAYLVGAIDCTDYYDRSVDPLPLGPGEFTNGYYKGSTPIADSPSGDPLYPGRERPRGILRKPTTSPGAVDIRDDYEDPGKAGGGTVPQAVSSRSVYQTMFLGNSVDWLVNQGAGGAGLSRSFLQVMSQDYVKIGSVVVGRDGMTIQAGTLGLPMHHAAALPECSPRRMGQLIGVKGAQQPQYDAPVRAGGTSVFPAFCDGISWRAR